MLNLKERLEPGKRPKWISSSAIVMNEIELGVGVLNVTPVEFSKQEVCYGFSRQLLFCFKIREPTYVLGHNVKDNLSLLN